MNDEHSEPEQPEGASDPESTGDAALDARLAEGVLKGGTHGIEAAQAAAAAFLIVVLALLAFSNTLSMPFTSMEREGIVEVEAMHNLLTAPQAWTDQRIAPLAAVSLAIDWMTGAGSPFVFRLMNVLIHAANGVLVFLLARRLTGEHASQLVPASAGALFVAHPAMTQSVSLLLNRGIVEGTLWFLLSCVLFLRAADATERFRALTYGVSLACYALAFAAWPIASIGALLILALDVGVHRRMELRRRFLLHAPLWLLTAGLLTAYGAAGGWDATPVTTGLSLTGLGDLLVTLVYPPALSAAYPQVSAVSGYGAMAGVAVAAVLLIWRAGAPGVALFWFAAALAVYALYPYARAISESALYLPLAGLVWLAPMAMQRLSAPRARLGAGAAVAVLSLVFAGFTYTRNQDWNDETELWRDARADCPTCTEPLLRLADIFIASGEESLRLAQQASAQGNVTEASNQRGLAESYFRRARGAIGDLQELTELPAEGWVLLGTAQRYQGELAAAEASLSRALRMKPDDYRATLQMAILTEAQAVTTSEDQRATIQRAIELYARAGELGPLPPDIRMRLAAAWQTLGVSERAAQVLGSVAESERTPAMNAMLADARESLQARQAVQERSRQVQQANPNSPELPGLLARQLFLQGSYVQASYLIESLARNRPITQEQWYMLGVCRAKMDGLNRFLQAWTSPPPGDEAAPWRTLAKRLAETGEWNAARDVLYAHPVGETLPDYTLAAIATELNDPRRAVVALEHAAEQRPADPEPWLRMSELAYRLGDTVSLQRLLLEAENRGAPEARIEELRERAGIEASEPARTIIE